MSLEDTLAGWTGPSSETEQEKQERTERMVNEAIRVHPGLSHCGLTVYAKGSYANNTNVRVDSDVDIAVQCHEAEYWDAERPGIYLPANPYRGPWTPDKLRAELGSALQARFPGQVDASGSTAFTVRSSSARVDADVVPCFDYRYYFSAGGSRAGTQILRTDGQRVVNYPDQQIKYGEEKDERTYGNYKSAVRILKRAENAMVRHRVHRSVPSFLIESLVYNCVDTSFWHETWTEIIRNVFVNIWTRLQGGEPSSERWVEVNECKWLFGPGQPWTRETGREFSRASWNYLGYKA